MDNIPRQWWHCGFWLFRFIPSFFKAQMSRIRSQIPSFYNVVYLTKFFPPVIVYTTFPGNITSIIKLIPPCGQISYSGIVVTGPGKRKLPRNPPKSFSFPGNLSGNYFTSNDAACKHGRANWKLNLTRTDCHSHQLGPGGLEQMVWDLAQNRHTWLTRSIAT